MDNHFPDYDDSSWITTCERRSQQLLRKDAYPESVLSEKDMQPRQPLRLPKSSGKKKELKAGIRCNLCFVSASDNALMEQHLMGQAHVKNVEKEAKKSREKIEFQKNSGVSNETVDTIASDVEASHCVQGRTHDDTVGKSAIEDSNIMDDTHRDEKVSLSKNKNIINEVTVVQSETTDETVISAIENSNIMDDTHRDEKVSLSKNKNNINEVIVVQSETTDETVKSAIENSNEKVSLSKNKNDINEVTVVQSEITDEMNSCELCKYFQGDKHQIPEHFCQNFYKSPELPAGWTEKTSRTSGCTYYVNNVTKVKQWHWPTEPASAESSETVECRADKEATAQDELPQGWVEKKAKSNGLPFFVNKLTNDWQWDRPINSSHTKVTGDFSAATSKDVEKNSDNSPGVTEAGMMVCKLKKTKSNEVEKLPVKSPTMNSNLNRSSVINQEDQLKLDLKHWKQATELWNSL